MSASRTNNLSDTGRPLGDSYGTAAYGGDGWSPRTQSHEQEMGSLWTRCGIDTEWQPLRSVLVHRPGKEMDIPEGQANAFQFAENLDVGKARAEHDYMVECYQQHGVKVHYLDTGEDITPNQLYCADLFAMTPQGAVLARPASTVRAGEEVRVSRTLSKLNIPVIKMLTGNAVFEGADLMWVDQKTTVIGRGLRTNAKAIFQIETLLNEMGIDVYAFDMPYGCMHFMGMMRIVDKDLAYIWPRRTPHALVDLLTEKGFQVLPLPDVDEATGNMAFNFIVLAPRKIMLAAGNPKTLAAYEGQGLECISVPVDELRKANGAMGCMTGILGREKTKS